GWSFMEYMGMSEEMANKAVYTYRERYEAVGLFENRVYPGIRRLLRMLHRDGWYIGIATGKPQRSSERIIEHFGLNRYITKIVGPKDGRGADKELLIRQALPEDAGEAWMVGDRRFDMEGAKKVGIGAIGAGYGYGSREELMNSGCDVYCETVEDIIRHLCPGEEAVPGAFLSIEGMDGSGKTTQMAAMEDALDRWGFEVIRSREPGGCPISEKIRALLLDPENKAMDETTEAILYAAARAQHVRQVIRPALKAGKTVLCDRFVDSSVAYQGGGRQLGVDTVLNINRPAVDGTMPMLTVYLDIDREAALRRRAASSQLDRIEQADDAFRTRTEAAYHELIRREPERFIVVDAAKPAEEVSRDMTEKVIQRLMEAEA
ncbi:MAG: dTMP kinase, partial [Clostridia bacterium]|nr:dTMP kinase [Clostridia bacterium]